MIPMTCAIVGHKFIPHDTGVYRDRASFAAHNFTDFAGLPPRAQDGQVSRSNI